MWEDILDEDQYIENIRRGIYMADRNERAVGAKPQKQSKEREYIFHGCTALGCHDLSHSVFDTQ